MKKDELTLALKKLPKEPIGKIYWVVYDEDTIDHTKKKFEEILGKSYLKNVKFHGTNSKNKINVKEGDLVYFDPLFYKHKNIGYN